MHWLHTAQKWERGNIHFSMDISSSLPQRHPCNHRGDVVGATVLVGSGFQALDALFGVVVFDNLADFGDGDEAGFALP